MSDQATWDQPEPAYTDFVRSSQYVAMSDGVRLATDLYLPAPSTPDDRFPTVLVITPYCRGIDVDPAVPEVAAAAYDSGDWGRGLSAHGFAVLVVEARGAAASFGQRSLPRGPETPRDDNDLVEWVIAQPWSNGRVGATGVSAPGAAALWLTTAHHPAVRAVAPLWTAFDMYTSTHPGGSTISAFVAEIGEGTRAIDRNELGALLPDSAAHLRPALLGLRKVDEDADGSLLRAALADHRRNLYIDRDLLAVTYRDEPLPQVWGGMTLDRFGAAHHLDLIRESKVPIYAYAGWYDGAFGNDLVTLHRNAETPASQLILGPWGHGGRFDDSPTNAPGTRSRFDHNAELAAFFGRHLRDDDLPPAPTVRYFTGGAREGWCASESWPPASRPSVVHLGDQLSLTDQPEEGVDRYLVDFDYGSGATSRYSRSAFPVGYEDRAAVADRLLTYTGPPLQQELEVTGHPLLQLHVSADREDFLLVAYLEDVSPDGSVTLVGEGVLRALFRTASAPPAGLTCTGPYRSFTRADAAPVAPGEVVHVEVELFPLSWVFGAGHRVRLSLAGGDADNFLRVPERGDLRLEVHRGADHPSRLVLPVPTGG